MSTNDDTNTAHESCGNYVGSADNNIAADIDIEMTGVEHAIPSRSVIRRGNARGK